MMMVFSNHDVDDYMKLECQKKPPELFSKGVAIWRQQIKHKIASLAQGIQSTFGHFAKNC